MDRAVQLALEQTDQEDTLIIVTADHSHTLTINGYPKRGNNILGIAGVAKDNLTYTTLVYGNGVGFWHGRKNTSRKEYMDKDYTNYAAIPFQEGPLATEARHGGEDVPVYARGPGAYLFTGVYDQIFVAHGISYAACVGPHRDLCGHSQVKSSYISIHSQSHLFTVIAFMAILALIYISQLSMASGRMHGYESFI